MLDLKFLILLNYLNFLFNEILILFYKDVRIGFVYFVCWNERYISVFVNFNWKYGK